MNNTVLEHKESGSVMRSHILLLYEIAFESKPNNILEIGVGSRGQSTKVFLSALKENENGTLTSIDDGARKSLYKNINERFGDYWKMIVGDSHSIDTYNKVKDIKFDLMFIDGDHTYEGVKKDFEMYVPLLKDGGLILMHDTINDNEGVKDFWKEIKYPKVNLEFGKSIRGIIPGMGIVQVVK